jgi:hypothetical protein
LVWIYISTGYTYRFGADPSLAETMIKAEYFPVRWVLFRESSAGLSWTFFWNRVAFYGKMRMNHFFLSQAAGFNFRPGWLLF